MNILNRENVLSFALAIVAAWFGYYEIRSPGDWVGMVPVYVPGPKETLVFLHGVLLMLCAAGLVFNFKRRLAGAVLAVLLVGIVVTLFQNEAYDVAIRDVGLLGMAIALAMKD